MASVLGLDVGGTKIAMGPVDRTGTQLAASLVEPTRTRDREAFLRGLVATVRRGLERFSEFAPCAIGFACAGTVDSARGVLVASPHLPLSDFPLGAYLEENLRLPVFIENDVNAAVRSEVIAGAAKGLRDVVMLAVGTGVGGGLWLGGRLYRGAGGGAGELGHMVVRAGGLPCACGGHGCLEVYASGRALVRYAAARAGDAVSDPQRALAKLEEEGKLTGPAVAQLAAAGHPGALEAVAELSRWLGVGLINLTDIFDPEMIVVGGGVAELGELLLAPARDLVRRYALPPGGRQVRITIAELGNEAGLVGGALAAWEHLEGGVTVRGSS